MQIYSSPCMSVRLAPTPSSMRSMQGAVHLLGKLLSGAPGKDKRPPVEGGYEGLVGGDAVRQPVHVVEVVGEIAINMARAHRDCLRSRHICLRTAHQFRHLILLAQLVGQVAINMAPGHWYCLHSSRHAYVR